jgi:hypothetical protein
METANKVKTAVELNSGSDMQSSPLHVGCVVVVVDAGPQQQCFVTGSLAQPLFDISPDVQSLADSTQLY